MGHAARQRAETCFDEAIVVDAYLAQLGKADEPKTNTDEH